MVVWEALSERVGIMSIANWGGIIIVVDSMELAMSYAPVGWRVVMGNNALACV